MLTLPNLKSPGNLFYRAYRTGTQTRRYLSASYRRGLQTSAVPRKDDDGSRKPAVTWPTAESVILQRISSTGIGSPATAGKTRETEAAGRDADKKDEEPGGDGGSVLSVSGIINSVREQRAASQQAEDGSGSGGLAEIGAAAGGGERGGVEPGYFLFDTHELVDRLMAVGFTRGQATLMMALVSNRVHRNMARVAASMLSRSDLENDAYLFRSALQELRTETQVIRKNDQAILESQAAAISRDIDSLAQKINDEIANLRSDIEIELNNRKHETNHEMKSLDMELHDLASKYQVVVGEMKTGIEAIKLESIRKGLVTAVLTTLLVTVVIWTPELVDSLRKRRTGQGKGRDRGEDEDKDDAHQQQQMEMQQQQQQMEMQQGQQQQQLAAISTATGLGASGKLYPAVLSSDGQVLIQKGDASTSTRDDGVNDDGYRAAAGRRFHDHSHLNIRYDPSASPYNLGPRQDGLRSPSSSREYGRGISSSDSQESYDDWFDSFFYSPRAADGPESASLMDSDSRMDSSLLDAAEQKSEARGAGQEEALANGGGSGEPAQPVVHVPLHFTYHQDRDAAAAAGGHRSSDADSDK